MLPGVVFLDTFAAIPTQFIYMSICQQNGCMQWILSTGNYIDKQKARQVYLLP